MRCVGRSMTPNAVSNVARGARTASGKRALSSQRRSCQSRRVAKSIRARARPQPHVLDDAAVAERAHEAHGGAVRAALDDLGRLGRGQLGALLGVPRVDVPRVPLARLVDVGPQLVAATGEHLAAGALVDHARERAVGGEVDPDELVLQPLGARPTGRPPGALGGPRRLEPGDLRAPLTAAPPASSRAQRARREIGVDRRAAPRRRRRPTARRARPARALDHLAGRVDHSAELGLGLLRHLADARAGQDVVELVAQQHAPLRLQRRRRSPPASAVSAPSTSAATRSRSARRCARFVRPCDVSVPRCSSR